MQIWAIHPDPHEYSKRKNGLFVRFRTNSVHASKDYSSAPARNSVHAKTGYSAASERMPITQTRAISPHPHE